MFHLIPVCIGSSPSETTVVLFASFRFSHVYRESTVEEHPRGNMGPSFRHVWVVPKKVPNPEAGLGGQGALDVCATASPCSVWVRIVKVEACCSALASPSHAPAAPGHFSIVVPTASPPPAPPHFFPPCIAQPREPGVLSVSAGMSKYCNAPLSLSSLAGGLVPIKGSR